MDLLPVHVTLLHHWPGRVKGPFRKGSLSLRPERPRSTARVRGPRGLFHDHLRVFARSPVRMQSIAFKYAHTGKIL